MSEPNPADDPSRQIARRDFAALGLVAVLVLLDQAMIQPTLLRLLTDAPAINAAGRQRMLSQTVVKSTLALDAARTGPERARWRRELDRAFDVWTVSHERLRADARRTRPGVRSAFADLQPFYARMRDSAARRARGQGAPETDALLSAEAEYLPRMDRLVGLYEREARDRVGRLRRTGWALTALILAALGGIGAFIMRPAARTIARQVDALRQARDTLEIRVQERTAELARVNRVLERESTERSEAEERHRRLLEQFSHVARTTAVGELASGLAHELNQPLGAVANYVEGCLVALDATAPELAEVRSALDKALTNTLRAGAIVQRVRRFVTRHEPTRAAGGPGALVGDAEGFLRDELTRAGVVLRTEVAPDLPLVWCDPVQVQQVLVNLVRNAMDALDASQTLEPRIVITAERDDSGGVGVAVTDNGEGIPDDRLSQVFDAYFSTRDGGMGMGLAITRSIVEAHHGRIGVESVPGVRTTFRFTLPAAGG